MTAQVGVVRSCYSSAGDQVSKNPTISDVENEVFDNVDRVVGLRTM